MDPVSAIASIVGIVGFGIQVAQILQKEIDAIQTATERVEQIVIEIRATATGLTNLQDFLLQDHEASLDDRIFNDDGRNEITHIVRRCNTVFRNITVLVAKAGNRILSSVDQFQRQVEEEHKERKGIEKSDVKLEIELSNLEHLMWPWKLPKIEQYIADLDRLKLSLVLILSVANLAKTKKQKKVKDNDAESEKWEGSQAETLVQDEIFYQDRGLQEAEKKYETLTVGGSPTDRVTQSTHAAAQVLISNWPDSPSARGISSITELHESGVILEGFAFNPDEFEQNIIEMPLNMRSMQDHALKRSRWGSRKSLSVWDAFARLPNYQQEMILTFLAERKRQLYDYTRDDPPLPPQLVLISLNVAKYRWQRFLEALRRFRDFDVGNAPKRSTLFIVIARVTQPHSNGSEPLISSTKPWRRPSKADRDDSESTSSNDPSSSASRSRRRSRVRYSRSRSRSRTRGHRRGLVVAAARGLKAAYKNRKSERIAEERRSRRRSRRRRYSSDSDAMYEAYGGAQARGAKVAGAQQSTGLYDYAANHTGYPPSSIESEAPKAGDQGDDESQLRRVTTLNETDGNEPSTVPPPPPQREPTVIETERIFPPPPPPPPQLATTFQEDENNGGRSVGGQALAALGLRSTSRRGQDASRPTENKIARKNTGARSSRDLYLTRGERSRRDRSRSRSRAMMPRLSKWRNRSSSKERRNRRSKKEDTVMRLFRKSPERPILRTYTDDGVPPTQRDKAAVAEYYLKKWTTAYDHVRAQNLGRRYTTRAAGRSRSRYVPEPGLIEYGNEPVYGSQAPYYPPPPGQGGYYDANPYQGAYNPTDYHPAGVQTPGAGAADASPYKAQGQKTTEERDRDRDRDTSESNDGRRRRQSRKEDDSSASDKQAQTYTPHPTPGNVHTDDEEEEEKHPTQPPAGLTVPSHQRAYAESVPDNGNEKEGFVEEVE